MSGHVGVYGLGRFGSFWAELLARHFEVRAYSRSVERATPEGVIRVSEDEVLSCPTLFLCVAISAFEEVVRRMSGRIRPGTLVLDTCSVKVHPVRVMSEALPRSAEILATHPMFGPDSARYGVQGLPMIVWPVRVAPARADRWKRFFLDLGLRVEIMTPDDHDREAAFTQGVTHYIGRVLADLELEPSKIGTLGYAKLLEIIEQTCNDPWQLFVDLQRYNPYTRPMRERLHSSLQRIMRTLDSSLDSAGQAGE